jgi:L-rhamnose-H+ transport protein
VFSALINIGFSFAGNIIEVARGMGVTTILSAVSPWCLFFSSAFLVNFGYCLFLMIKRKNTSALWTPDFARNFSLGISMGALFVCAIYVYSMGATYLGSWGEVPGWIVFMSIDITTGNAWGLWTGEWRGVPRKARRLLVTGTTIILAAVLVVAASQLINNHS